MLILIAKGGADTDQTASSVAVWSGSALSVFILPSGLIQRPWNGSLYISRGHGLEFQIKMYSKTCVKQPLSKRPKIGFQDQLLLIAGQKYCRMLQGEHSAILSTFIKLPFVIKIFVLSIFEWPFYIGF